MFRRISSGGTSLSGNLLPLELFLSMVPSSFESLACIFLGRSSLKHAIDYCKLGSDMILVMSIMYLSVYH